MRLSFLFAAAALSLAAACDRDEPTRASPAGSAPATASSAPAPSSPPSSSASAGASATTPTTPANVGAPGSDAQRKEGTNPVQGQIDPKQREQHRDFQQRGDAAGPTSPETKPKN